MEINITNNQAFFIFCVIAIMAIIAIILLLKINQLTTRFKASIFKPIMQKKFPKCVYKPDKTITKNEFGNIGCFKIGNNFFGEDLLYAKTNKGFYFRYCEVNTFTYYSYASIHQGIVYFEGAIISFNSTKTIKQTINSCFYIVSKTNKAEDYFYTKLMSDIKKTGTENALFDQHFKLYTNDLTSAYTILKPQNLEGLIAIKTKYKNLIIAFKDSQVHIILPGINLFNAPGIIFSSKKSSLLCKKCCNDLAYLIDVINDFDYF